MVAVMRARRRSDEVTPEDIANLIEDWADWKTNRPRDRDKEQLVASRPEFGPRIPKGVWMTPAFKVYLYQDVSAAYESLEQDPRAFIFLRYLCGLLLHDACLAFETPISQAHARNLEHIAFWNMAEYLNKKSPG